jgi:hypothetical protein
MTELGDIEDLRNSLWRTEAVLIGLGVFALV